MCTKFLYELGFVLYILFGFCVIITSVSFLKLSNDFDYLVKQVSPRNPYLNFFLDHSGILFFWITLEEFYLKKNRKLIQLDFIVREGYSRLGLSETFYGQGGT